MDKKRFVRTCPLCMLKMTVLLDPGNFGDFVWYCDQCELMLWNDMMIKMDRQKKYVEE